MIFLRVLSALFLLLQKIIQSSAYRTNLCPLRVSSLSSSFSMTLLSNGLNGSPCGIPISVFSNTPLLIIPALRYLCISDITRPSLIVLDNTSISLLWHTVSKNFSMSMSTAYTYPSLTFFWHCFSAPCAPLFLCPAAGRIFHFLTKKEKRRRSGAFPQFLKKQQMKILQNLDRSII